MGSKYYHDKKQPDCFTNLGSLNVNNKAAADKACKYPPGAEICLFSFSSCRHRVKCWYGRDRLNEIAAVEIQVEPSQEYIEYGPSSKMIQKDEAEPSRPHHIRYMST